MSIFHGGPADNVSLTLSRSPLLLRVVYDVNRDEFDALDQLDDALRQGETPYAYRRTGGQPFSGFIDYCGKDGRRRGQRFSEAEYQFIEQQPPLATMQDNAAWREWCQSVAGSATPCLRGENDAQ